MKLGGSPPKRKTINPDNLVIGKKYRVRFSTTGRSTKEMVAVYLGETKVRQRTLAFDLRPLAGTQVLKPREITAIWVSKDEVSLPTTVKPEAKERRVF